MARNLHPVDWDRVIADYGDGVPVADILATHRIGTTALYRRLDEAGVPRRETHARRIDDETRRAIADAYWGGTEDLRDIAARFGVSSTTVSNIGIEAAQRSRQQRRSRDELVELAAHWIIGDPIDGSELLRAVAGLGVDSRLQPGLRSLAGINPDLRADVARRVAELILDRWGGR